MSSSTAAGNSVPTISDPNISITAGDPSTRKRAASPMTSGATVICSNDSLSMNTKSAPSR